MTDADRQLLTEVRDLLRQVVNGNPVASDNDHEIALICAAPDIGAAIKAWNRRKKCA